ncbi:MAG TPA: glycoside hydrolase family 127 protein [Candidatus Eisenbergiella stercorigallinarum]|uniref:Glycoside hydrolase family 127 protein n=1 Tax=Candidatus Eisenbergiella stercorigallinarum TaxID=2838557 RepID=A0A9D2QW61_9FIRM|nr:glycoside hydrolase family 127 protein [Candidatus Eisenbergiella stercorigallinarum]
MKENLRLKELDGRGTRLTDPVLLAREADNRSYMMHLENRFLLLNYNLEAGRDSSSDVPEGIHTGWEFPTCQLRGHFLGHWLSAAAMHYRETGDMELKAKADAIVSELAECQKENGGQWVGPFPEKYLYWIAEGKPVWAPHYTLHKIFMGLLDMYEYAGNETALQIAERFADWFYEWSGKYSREQFDDILDFETGGMLEIWVQLYELTGNARYRTLMDRYYRGRLFDALLRGEDVLTNMHANTTIPEIIGCARAYDATGEEKWRDIAENYWRLAVTERGAYATGGQTCGEIWSPMKKLSARLGQKGQEHCTVYNMMRLAGFLFRWSGDPSFLDYQEKLLYNGIMAQGYWHSSLSHGFTSPYPKEGLLTYFLPMQAGGRKGWSSKTGDFFCCHGTLVQANAAFNRGLYHQSGNTLYVSQYFDSEVHFTVEGRPVTLLQKADPLTGSAHLSSDSSARQSVLEDTRKYPSNPDCLAPCLRIDVPEETEFTLMLRIPAWVQKEARIIVNQEEPLCISRASCFVPLSRTWKKGDVIRILLPRAVTSCPLPDQNDMAAFLYGPVVLAGLCDEERTLRVPDPSRPEQILVHDNEREWGSWKSTFRATGQERGIRFIPLHEVGYEPYSIYFPVRKERPGEL